jgi:transposase
VAVTLQAADMGDTTTMNETLIAAGSAVSVLVVEQAESHSEESKINIRGIEELVADKGYLSGAVLKRVKNYGVHSYIPEKRQKGKRRWAGKADEQQAAYENRRRVRGNYGKRLLKRRSELVERSFAHCYETGGLRRCHLRGRENILKRQLIHVGAFNLSLILRKILGAGTPRELKNKATRLFLQIFRLLTCRNRPQNAVGARTASVLNTAAADRSIRPRCRIFWNSATSTTGC